MNILTAKLAYLPLLFLTTYVISFEISASESSRNPSWITLDNWENLPQDSRLEGRILELSGLVEAYLANTGYRLGSGARGDFSRAIERAAREIESAPEARQREMVESAEKAFKTMIDQMIVSSKRIPNYSTSHFRTIGEQTFYEAKISLCPLWPFC